MDKKIKKLLSKIREIFHFVTTIDAYDKVGNLKYLLGRNSNIDECVIENIPLEITDKALDIICDSFDIPITQKYCLRLNDKFMDIYESFNYGGADHMEFERLSEEVLDFINPCQSEQPSFDKLETVGDLILFIWTNIKNKY